MHIQGPIRLQEYFLQFYTNCSLADSYLEFTKAIGLNDMQ